MDIIQDIGIIGFLFFFFKGLIWLIVFALMYFGLVDRQKVQALKSKFNFWKRKTG